MSEKAIVSRPGRYLDECLFVIFGGAGDLAKRKLIPALYKLINDGRLEKFGLLAVSIDETTIEDIVQQVKGFIHNPKQHILDEIVAHAYYMKMNFHENQRYKDLKKKIEDIENKHDLKGNRIFYFATMPEHFDVLTKNLAKEAIVTPVEDAEQAKKSPWSRLVYEKPFGNDFKSAQLINTSIEQAFHESQIFRIDHYLGKELVGNIALVRFTNQIFEPLWNNNHIESVQIIMKEAIGIEGRGAFYDANGALKDMVQSHMLQIFALIGMEPPSLLTPRHIRDQKAALLSKTYVDSVIKGQYEGYQDELRVRKESSTETFVALKCLVDNQRWKGVPFYLKTGKFLDKKETSIHIRFKQVPCLLDICPSDSNYLTIRINPNEGMYLELNVKVPGVPNRVMPVTMDFAHNVMFGPNTPEAYEVLLADVMQHDHSAFVRADEIQHSWRIVEEAYGFTGQLYSYKKGSKGPTALYLLDQDREIRWRA